ncbi:PQQ-dependent sugar dehydrogenase [Sphingomonas sp. MAH-20]|uniref:PQQ-dependent sugar dehydrogenase n=1 Tax=Sphingomonas horti TaxID=2682842 RepID=A0A6I4J3T1_9SPHN|nr:MULTISPECIES: PQQ-dependent sugar dehydrogenase [Sphingomonas]MBA2921171.1 PQQ-dependent sugar dehydrogenase [Sphingomonas sp. CGMCC 1.13658]MVO79412.1 PQQ-dependent sugar dehydrogenase [Sphingomonas horti]
MRMRLISALAVAVLTGCGSAGGASKGADAERPSEARTASARPFDMTVEGCFDRPFAMAFLPDGRLLVTEKPGVLKLWAPGGETIDVAGVPKVAFVNQGGLLDVALSPRFAQDHDIYLTYSEPRPKGSSLALARAQLVEADGAARLDGLRVIWRQGSDGSGGQFGGVIAFSPDGKYLFLTSGERQRKTPAQDPNQTLGKILRLYPDGTTPPFNPISGSGARSQIWSSGHRNPYGLAFAADGRLWETEMGPKGGDELNMILPGRNYGWPVVSNGDNYDGSPIPDHHPGDGFAAPKLSWNPSISPGGFIIYSGSLFPRWRGSGLIAALSGEALIRVTLDGDTAAKADRWDMGARIRDVAQGPQGTVWLLEDGKGARLLKLTPAR